MKARVRQIVTLAALSAADGKILSEMPLESVPVFDGMVAANGMLFLSLTDGSLVCFGSE